MTRDSIEKQAQEMREEAVKVYQVQAHQVARRMWINQPSTLQPAHGMHGEKVIAVLPFGFSTATVFFIDGETISAQIPVSALSNGWPSHDTTKIARITAERDAARARARRLTHLLAIVEDDIHDAHTLGLVRAELAVE